LNIISTRPERLPRDAEVDRSGYSDDFSFRNVSGLTVEVLQDVLARP
jgi:hypothetical protein